jgi:uncharacterized protein YjiS (DUF1127 family)
LKPTIRSRTGDHPHRTAQEMTMLENVNDGLRPSAYELERSARKARSVAVNTCMRGLAHLVGEWLRALMRMPGRLARRMAAKARYDSAVRALRALDDRTLADIGIGRSEIEFSVRSGRSTAMVRKLRRRQRGWSSVTPERKAA